MNYKMPKAQRTQKIEKLNGFTGDIIDSVISCYNDTKEQTKDFAQDFIRNSDYDTCKAIAEFVYKTINYKEDPVGKQWIKTPARFIEDREGDCKSYSIFICSCLANLGIEHAFRFVCYKGNDYTHVYVVAYINGEELPIDVVAMQLKNADFGTEIKYKKKQDMRGTTISRLSGIGNAEPNESGYVFYTSNIEPEKVNEMYLLSEINLLDELAKIEPNENERQKIYNKMDFLEATLRAVNFSDRTDLLEIAGLLLCKYANDGVFSGIYDSMDKRVQAFESNMQAMKQDFDNLSGSSDTEAVVFTDEFRLRNSDLLQWWNEKIVARNYKPVDSVSGIGAVDTAMLIEAIAPTMIYATQDYDMSSAKAKLKQKKERKLIEYIKRKHPTYDTDTIKNIISRGIIKTFGVKPERVISNLKGETKKVAGVGALDLSALGDMVALENKNNTSSVMVSDLKGVKTNEQLLQTLDSNIAEGKASSLSWIDALTGITNAISTTADSITKVVGAIAPLTGATQQQVQASVGFQGITPNTDDWTSSPVVIAVGAGALGLGAYLLLSNNKRRK